MWGKEVKFTKAKKTAEWYFHWSRGCCNELVLRLTMTWLIFVTDDAKDHVAISKHNQTCIDTCLAFSRSCWVLICTRWNLQLLQSKRKQINLMVEPMTVCLSEPLFRVFIDSNVFWGFSSNTFKRRKPLAWSDFWSLSKICYLQTIPSDLKLRLFRTTCLSILLYGCQTWIITKDMSEKLNAFAMSCYRIMLNRKNLRSH